jgi:hypothetical protein
VPNLNHSFLIAVKEALHTKNITIFRDFACPGAIFQLLSRSMTLANRGTLMVSPQLERPLDKYHVGDKLRQLRLLRMMGLVEVGTDQELLESGDCTSIPCRSLTRAALASPPAAPS